MPIKTSDVPQTWIPETGVTRTLQEIQQAVQSGNCAVKISRETWTYETTLQGIWNFLKTTVTGLGAERSFSTGTAIRIYFSCATDTQTAERRRVIKSHSLHLDAECLLTITKVTQEQAQVERSWVRWTLTLTFEDDIKSSAIDGVVGSLVSLLGVRAEGVVDIFSGIAGSFLSITDAFGDASNRHIWVARETAAPEHLWVDIGSPASVLLSQIPLLDELCHTFRLIFQTGENDRVTVPAAPGTLDR